MTKELTLLNYVDFYNQKIVRGVEANSMKAYEESLRNAKLQDPAIETAE